MSEIKLDGGNGIEFETIIVLIEKNIRRSFEDAFKSASKILLVQNADGTIYGFSFFEGIQDYIRMNEEGFWRPTTKITYYTISANTNLPTIQNYPLLGKVVVRTDYT